VAASECVRPADETALVIEAAEAEPLVAEFRAAFDRSAVEGAPAHVTLLYPFLHPDAISDEELRELGAFFARRASFDFELAGVCGFPGVLYLVPDPLPPFDGLTRALADRYPACPPYGGAFADPIPHLTVAQSPPAPSLDDVAARFQARADAVPPIRCTAGSVTLLVKRGGRWSRGPRFPLAAVATRTIETARLRLVPLAPEHADALHEVYRDPAVRRFLVSRPTSREDFERIFARALECGRTLGMWAIFPRDGDQLLGRCGFYSFSERARPELAILLASEAWGRGLASEAAGACLRFAFEERGWSEVVALVRPGNAPALRVLHKLGMSPEATLELAGEPAQLHRMTRAGLARTTVRAAPPS